MRQIAWKQWKTPRNRYKQLKSRGVSEFWAIRLGGSSLGPWRIANSAALIYALDNAYWRRVGLVSFLQLYTLRHT
jgi:RNA-directed DNA polymerase